MTIIKKACAGCGGAAIGISAAMHAPCLLIVLGVSSGLSASAALGLNFYGAIAMTAAGAIAGAYALAKRSWIGVAGASLLATTSAAVVFSQVSSPANAETLALQAEIVRSPNMSLLEREAFVRKSVCGQVRP